MHLVFWILDLDQAKRHRFTASSALLESYFEKYLNKSKHVHFDRMQILVNSWKNNSVPRDEAPKLLREARARAFPFISRKKRAFPFIFLMSCDSVTPPPIQRFSRVPTPAPRSHHRNHRLQFLGRRPLCKYGFRATGNIQPLPGHSTVPRQLVLKPPLL